MKDINNIYGIRQVPTNRGWKGEYRNGLKMRNVIFKKITGIPCPVNAYKK